MKKNKICALLLGGALLSATTIVGCTSGGGSGSKGADSISSVANRAHPVTISPMGSIPLTGTAHQFSLRINNASDDDYTLSKIEVIDPLTGKSASDQMSLNSASCEKVAKGSYCIVKLTPKVNKSAAFIVKATLTSGSKQETVSQMIRVSDKIKARNGVYFDNDINELMADVKGKYSLVLPMVLDENFKSLNVTNGFLNCESNSKGSACTYVLDGSISADKTMVATNIVGVDKTGKSETLVKSDTLVRTNNPDYSHILLSQPEDIIANADGTHSTAKVIAFNLGNQNATNLQVTAPRGFAAANGCGTEMLSSSTCIIDVTLAQNEGEVSLAGTLEVGYTAVATPKVAKAGLFYDASVLGIGLDIVGIDGFFMNTLVGTNKQTTYAIRNTGLKTLKDIKLNLEAGDLVLDGNDCLTELQGGAQCQATVSYAPTAASAQALTRLAVSGTFVETGKGTRSIYAEKGIEYSAVAAVSLFQLNPAFHSFVAVTGGNPHQKSYSIVNASNYTANLGTPAITTNVQAGEFEVISNPCAQLAPGANCAIEAKFAPANDYDLELATISIPLAPIAGAAAPAPLELSASLTSNADATLPADIEVNTQVSNSPFATVTQNTVNNINTVNSIAFAMFSSREVKVTYTFTNKGLGVANNFNVATAGISSAFLVDTNVINTTCPIGNDYRALLTGETCTVTVSIPKEKYFTSGLLYGNGFTGPLSLAYIYENLNNQGAHVVADTPETNVNITSNLVTNTTLSPTVRKETDGYYIDLAVVLGNVVVDPFPNAPKVVNISASIEGVVINRPVSCEVVPNSATQACNDIIKLPLAFPAGDHFLDVTIAHASDANIAEHKVVEFTIPATPVNP